MKNKIINFFLHLLLYLSWQTILIVTYYFIGFEKTIIAGISYIIYLQIKKQIKND
jgi:hypothetical protein